LIVIGHFKPLLKNPPLLFWYFLNISLIWDVASSTSNPSVPHFLGLNQGYFLACLVDSPRNHQKIEKRMFHVKQKSLFGDTTALHTVGEPYIGIPIQVLLHYSLFLVHE